MLSLSKAHGQAFGRITPGAWRRKKADVRTGADTLSAALELT
jgi:hypothetical protein